MAEAHRRPPADLLQPLSDHHLLLLPPATTASHGRRPPAHRRHSRLGMATGGGEIVEVEGGHIVRAIGRKDRHSKVFTSKGPRDRRVRLSAHTAIQFYDVQDRLGYDRPSKAVDWLIENAKAAIAELPPRCPLAAVVSSGPAQASSEQEHNWEAVNVSTEKPIPEAGEAEPGTCGFGVSSILPPSLDSDAIADTIKSFFPMAASATAGTSSRPAGVFRSYPPQLLQSSSAQAQDLRLSLQSFPEPVLLQHRESRQPNASHHHRAGDASGHANFFSTSSPHLPFDAPSASWPDLSQRMFSWNASAEMGGGGAGYILLPPTQQATPLHPVLGQSQFLSQRGPLQSSSSPQLVGAWADSSAAEAAAAAALPPGPLISAAGFAPAGLGGFRIPARIQGEEEQGGINKKPPPAASSSASRH